MEELLKLQKLCELMLEAVDVVDTYDQALGRRWWVRPINANRDNQGAGEQLVREMRYEDDESFFNFTRMTMSQFDSLLNMVGPKLQKFSNRESISPETRLLVTLRYLATGDSYRSLHYTFRIGYSTIKNIIIETCDAIYNILQPLYMPRLTNQKFEEIANGFEAKTSYPHIVGAIDGKHITIQAPAKSGTLYYNYKKTFSIVLLGICDAEYKFIYFNLGGYGSESDGGIFRNSSIGMQLENGEIDLPAPRPVYGSNFDVPYVFLGDAAFPLRPYLMTPYGGRNLDPEQIVHNRELSRGRCLIENTFGVLSGRWQIFLKL